MRCKVDKRSNSINLNIGKVTKPFMTPNLDAKTRASTKQSMIPPNRKANQSVNLHNSINFNFTNNTKSNPLEYKLLKGNDGMYNTM